VSKTQQLQEQLNNAKASLIQLETALKTNVGNAQAQLRSQQANSPSTDPGSVGISAAESKSGRSSPEAQLFVLSRAGRILRILTYPGEAISDGFCKWEILRCMWSRYETDVGLVKLGQPATITSERLIPAGK